MQDQRFLSATIDTVFALKGLERIGDHAKNIAEQVVFVASGEDVRHRKNEGAGSVKERTGWKTRGDCRRPTVSVSSFP